MARSLLTTWIAENPGAKVRLLGVGVGQLSESDQMDLFSAAAPVVSTPLDAALDAIREKFGPKALRPAGKLDED